jgi:hypothetical protein
MVKVGESWAAEEEGSEWLLISGLDRAKAPTYAR